MCLAHQKAVIVCIHSYEYMVLYVTTIDVLESLEFYPLVVTKLAEWEVATRALAPLNFIKWFILFIKCV